MEGILRDKLWVGLTILWALLSACDANNMTTSSGSTQTIGPSMQQIPDEISNLEIGQSPTYRDITPGFSKEIDVINQWGEPNVIREYGMYKSLHYFDNWIREYVLVKNDVVQAITSNDRDNWLLQDARPANLEDLTKSLGSPDVIMPMFGLPTKVFTNYGVAVSDYPSRVQTYQFFAPTSFREYQELWVEFPLGFDPFPLIPSVEATQIKPGATTREQVMSLLGNPDRIVSEESDIPWWYEIEPDGWGRLYISFSENDVVETMTISEFRKAILLEEIITLFGIPDTLQIMPDEHGVYKIQAFLYLEHGLRVSTNCIDESCEIVKRDANVIQKWYFQPKSLEEYQVFFPDSKFVEWPGFDQ